MASKLDIYCIYKSLIEESFFLLRLQRPSFSNASQTQEDSAESFVQIKRQYILNQIGKNYIKAGDKSFELIGEFQDYPIGDKLYLEKGKLELDVFYFQTAFGYPWIILGTAESEEDFINELNQDEDLLRLEPIGKPKQIKAFFLTENDFDLTQLS